MSQIIAQMLRSFTVGKPGELAPLTIIQMENALHHLVRHIHKLRCGQTQQINVCLAMAQPNQFAKTVVLLMNFTMTIPQIDNLAQHAQISMVPSAAGVILLSA